MFSRMLRGFFFLRMRRLLKSCDLSLLLCLSSDYVTLRSSLVLRHLSLPASSVQRHDGCINLSYRTPATIYSVHWSLCVTLLHSHSASPVPEPSERFCMCYDYNLSLCFPVYVVSKYCWRMPKANVFNYLERNPA